MPEPNYFEGFDPDEIPNPQLEVMGRGTLNRKSKTLLPNIELAICLGLVKEHIQNLYESFRAMHSAHYTVEVWIDPEDHSKGTKTIPEVLSDREIRDKYNSVAKWESFHQEQVDHYPSVGGFSTRVAMSYQDDLKRQSRQESSAGTDRNQNQKWD